MERGDAIGVSWMVSTAERGQQVIIRARACTNASVSA